MKEKLLVKILGVIMVLGAYLIPMTNLEAATIAELKTQVTVYQTSGEISTASLGDTLMHLLNDAGYYESVGDTASRDHYMESFRDTVTEYSGIGITPAAASLLLTMAQ
jgi:hypothetical protein